MLKQNSDAVIKDLAKLSSPLKAKSSARFFKTAEGQYGHGDVFIGVTVPEQRLVARRYFDLPLTAIKELLDSPIHEHRLTALLILVSQYESARRPDSTDRKASDRIVKFYLKNTKRINNWDLVDSSARYILGADLMETDTTGKPRDRKILYKLSMSHNIWERRIAIVATHVFIRGDDFTDAFKIAELLFKDKHDLIHKAVGWMLREVGKRSPTALHGFLDTHRLRMPRTSLRYAIERFSPAERRKYLNA